MRYSDGRTVAYLCDDRNGCDEQWDRERKLYAGEALYGAIGYREQTETAGVDRWIYAGSRSVNFGGF